MSRLGPELISEAVVVWTGRGRAPAPDRKEETLVERYGSELAADLYPVVRELASQFYDSDARHTVRGLHEMSQRAADEFRAMHPEISEDAVQALAWCYAFDYK